MNRLIRGRQAARRLLFSWGLRAQARLAGARLQLSMAPDVSIGKRVKFTFYGGTDNRVDLGPRALIQDDVVAVLRGGTLRMGPGSSIRKGSVLHLSGELILEGDNIVSYYNLIHCANRVRLGRWSSTNEFVTIVDSRHSHEGDAEFFYENMEAAPIDIGTNVWMANKSSILMGVTIGDDAVVAAHAVVRSDVPAKSMVAGIPARVVRQR